MAKWRNYNKDDILIAVKDSTSIRQVLTKLGIIPAGGNYQTIKKYIREFDIDTSHFLRQGWNKGKIIGPKRPLGDYLSNKFSIQSTKLRLRLLREGVFKHQCSRCKRKTWEKNPIPIELDHINGDSENNSLDNLRLLCPNCHALTPTYRGRNIKA